MVKRALAGLPGIKQVNVSLAEGKARVAYNPSQVTVERIVQAINRVGFRARALEGE